MKYVIILFIHLNQYSVVALDRKAAIVKNILY